MKFIPVNKAIRKGLWVVLFPSVFIESILVVGAIYYFFGYHGSDNILENKYSARVAIHISFLVTLFYYYIASKIWLKWALKNVRNTRELIDVALSKGLIFFTGITRRLEDIYLKNEEVLKKIKQGDIWEDDENFPEKYKISSSLVYIVRIFLFLLIIISVIIYIGKSLYITSEVIEEGFRMFMLMIILYLLFVSYKKIIALSFLLCVRKNGILVFKKEGIYIPNNKNFIWENVDIYTGEVGKIYEWENISNEKIIVKNAYWGHCLVFKYKNQKEITICIPLFIKKKLSFVRLYNLYKGRFIYNIDKTKIIHPAIKFEIPRKKY